MMRVDDWDQRLFAVIDRYYASPFDWGSSHCLHMAGDVVKAVRGDDFVLPEIPVCKNEKDAARLYKKHKVKSVSDVFAGMFAEIHRSQAQRGDLGTIGRATVVCVGVKWFGRTELGPFWASLDQVDTAFKV